MIISIINQKGGVGKTACAYNLAHALALENKSTCLIDLDPSANATKGFNITPTKNITSTELLLSRQPLTDFLYFVDVNQFLTMVPSSIHLALAQRDISARSFRESLLSKKLLNQTHEYILIDCSPTLSDLTMTAIYAADFFIIPVTYEEDALEGLDDLFRVMREMKEKSNYSYKILRCKKDRRKKRTNEYIEKQLSNFVEAKLVFDTIIHTDESINQAKIERKTIFQFSPLSQGALDFKKLTKELIND